MSAAPWQCGDAGRASRGASSPAATVQVPSLFSFPSPWGLVAFFEPRWLLVAQGGGTGTAQGRSLAQSAAQPHPQGHEMMLWSSTGGSVAQREVYCVSLQGLLEHEVTPAPACSPPEHSPPRPAPGSRHSTDRTSVRNKLLRNFLMLPRGCCRMLGGWRYRCWGWDSAVTLLLQGQDGASRSGGAARGRVRVAAGHGEGAGGALPTLLASSPPWS